MTVCSQIVATVSFCGRKSGFDAGFSESTRALPFNANACKLKAGCARARPTVCRSRLLLLCVKCDGSVESESSVELVDDQHQIGYTSFANELTESDTSDNMSEKRFHAETGGGNNSGKGNNGRFSGGGDGDGGGDDEDDGDHSHSELDKEYGRLLKSDEINAQLKAEGLTLPPDMAEAAKALGLRSLVLDRFIRLQGAAWPLGSAIRGSTMLRNRMLADQSFLFKLLTEIAIDSGCATIAEVKQRGDDFWNEFELFMADLVVGVVVDAALVSMLAPYIQFRRPATAAGVAGALSRTLQSLPSSVFEAATPGRTYSIQQRVASYFYKGLQYGAVGFGCGVIGQGIANMIMLLKRKLKKSDTDVPVPPLFKSALLWGVFLGVSSNTRYQIVNGLERVVEGASLSKRLPVIAMAFTICIRFANNIYGGMQFVDWARLSGVQ